MKRLSQQFTRIFASPEDNDSYQIPDLDCFIPYKCTQTVPKMKKAFYQFLHDQRDDSLKFIDEIDCLENLKSKLLIKKVQHIYYSYVLKKSVNISNEMIKKIEKKILEQIEDPKLSSIWILDDSAFQIFKPARDLVHEQLEKEQFPYFLESKYCIDVLKTHSQDPRIFLPNEVKEFPFKDENFEDSIISELDIQYLKSIFEKSNQWKTCQILQNRYDTHYFYSLQNFFPLVSLFSNPVCVKINYVLPFNFERTVTNIIGVNKIQKVDSNYQYIEVLKTSNTKELREKGFLVSENRGQCELESELEFSFPVSHPRKYYHSLSLEYDSKTKTLYKFTKPFIHNDVKGLNFDEKVKCIFHQNGKEEVKSCFLFSNFGLTAYQKVGDHTLISELTIFNMNGWGNMLSDNLVKKFATTRAEKIAKNMDTIISFNDIDLDDLDEKDACELLLKNLDIRKQDQTIQSKTQDHKNQLNSVLKNDAKEKTALSRSIIELLGSEERIKKYEQQPISVTLEVPEVVNKKKKTIQKKVSTVKKHETIVQQDDEGLNQVIEVEHEHVDIDEDLAIDLVEEKIEFMKKDIRDRDTSILSIPPPPEELDLDSEDGFSLPLPPSALEETNQKNSDDSIYVDQKVSKDEFSKPKILPEGLKVLLRLDPEGSDSFSDLPQVESFRTLPMKGEEN